MVPTVDSNGQTLLTPTARELRRTGGVLTMDRRHPLWPVLCRRLAPHVEGMHDAISVELSGDGVAIRWLPREVELKRWPDVGVLEINISA